MNIKKIMVSTVAASVMALSVAIPTFAAGTTVVVTPSNTQGWSTADTRPGGAVNYVSDTTSPYPSGALQLTTDSTNAAKAQYMHTADVPLSSVTDLSYYTKQVSGPAVADPSYQLPVYLNGGTLGFTTLVYEPYYNGTVTPGTWQQWNVASGLFWSSNTVTCSNGTVTGTPGGPATYTLAQIEALCPNAVVSGFGVNVGTYNPNYVVETDGVTFDGTTYNFELTNVPTSKDQCKDGGYKNFTDSNGQPFRNQGQCVSYSNHQ